MSQGELIYSPENLIALDADGFALLRSFPITPVWSGWSGLTSYWRMDETSGTNVVDSKGAYDGTNNGATVNSTGIHNTGYAFNGTSSYISMPNGILPWGTNTYTINMWIKFTSTSGNQSLTMTARTGQGVIIYYQGPPNNWVVHAKPNIVDHNYVFTPDTDWHMITCMGDSSGMRIYFDGSLGDSITNTANIVAPSTDTIEFGTYRSAGTIQSGWYFNGNQDEIGIWNRSLTTTEVSELYNSGSGIFY